MALLCQNNRIPLLFRAFLFENGVKSKVGGCIGIACKNLETVQAKQCSPQKPASAKRKAPYFLRSTVLFGGDYRADSDHDDPLAVHARRSPGWARPSLVWQQQKSTTHFCVVLFSGGDYRDRTGDLLHAMQALSRTTLKRTPRKACVNGYDLALIRQIWLKNDFLPNNQHSSMRTI